MFERFFGRGTAIRVEQQEEEKRHDSEEEGHSENFQQASQADELEQSELALLEMFGYADTRSQTKSPQLPSTSRKWFCEQPAPHDDLSEEDLRKVYHYKWNLLVTTTTSSQQFFRELHLLATYEKRFKAIVLLLNRSVRRDYAQRDYQGTNPGYPTPFEQSHHVLWKDIVDLQPLKGKNRIYCDFLFYHYQHFIRHEIEKSFSYYDRIVFVVTRRATAATLCVQILVWMAALMTAAASLINATRIQAQG